MNVAGTRNNAGNSTPALLGSTDGGLIAAMLGAAAHQELQINRRRLSIAYLCAAIMVPLFVMMAKLTLINTFTAILLPSIASVFIIFYFRQSTKAFPSELRDAARVDGLKEWQINARRIP